MRCSLLGLLHSSGRATRKDWTPACLWLGDTLAGQNAKISHKNEVATSAVLTRYEQFAAARYYRLAENAGNKTLGNSWYVHMYSFSPRSHYYTRPRSPNANGSTACRLSWTLQTGCRGYRLLHHGTAERRRRASGELQHQLFCVFIERPTLDLHAGDGADDVAMRPPAACLREGASPLLMLLAAQLGLSQPASSLLMPISDERKEANRDLLY